MLTPRFLPRGVFYQVALMLIAMAVMIGLANTAVAQQSLSTGNIQGAVTDPSGAVVPNANVTITNAGTGQVLSVTSNSAGLYNSGSLIPGNYRVRVEAKGFRTSQLPVTVEVGTMATGNIKLELGETSQVVEVQGSSVQVNTEQATIQGVVTPEQIENLPINGRNFLDLAQLEPGIQVQDGAGFDPTKNGFRVDLNWRTCGAYGAHYGGWPRHLRRERRNHNAGCSRFRHSRIFHRAVEPRSFFFSDFFRYCGGNHEIRYERSPRGGILRFPGPACWLRRFSGWGNPAFPAQSDGGRSGRFNYQGQIILFWGC